MKSAVLMIAIAAMSLCSAAAQSQNARYTNDRISFQPPPGWSEDRTARNDVLVQYLGPERADRTRPALNLIVQSAAISLSEGEINALAAELPDEFNSQGLENTQVTDHRKTTISGFDALQIDAAYNQGGTPMRLRQVYVPISEHNRTYLFTFVDTAKHFDESVSAANSAINSFTPAVSRAPARSEGASKGAGSYTLLLVIVGFAALAVVIGALYLLFQRQARA